VNENSITPQDLSRLHETCARIRDELGQVIVGQREVIDQLLISLLSGGHSLLVGVPGLAKTLLVRSLADVVGLAFNRIQFTPDLMPADITGTEVIHEDRATGERQFRFIQGPVFANVILADEINRTPPKTQAALLEAMQEHQVTVGGVRYPLPDPFFVLATQNPIEQEGTYPLPEAQLDRFMLEIRVDYPDEEDELDIVQRKSSFNQHSLSRVVSEEELREHQGVVRSVPMAEHDMRYAISLVRATRVQTAQVSEPLAEYLSWGAGPRASEWLVLAAKAHAAITGRDLATAQDVQAVLAPVLRHRLVTNFNAEADGISKDDLVQRLLASVPEPGQGESRFKRYVGT
jgi:MoxR-like ATPase